jgi:hypothetical protein
MKIKFWIVCLCVTLVATGLLLKAVFAQKKLESSGEITYDRNADCIKTENILGLMHSANLTMDENAKKFNLSLNVLLTHSPNDVVSYEPLIFLDTKQYELSKTLDLKCGESQTVDYSVSIPEQKPEVVNLFYRTLPVIPRYLKGKSFEEISQQFPDAQQGSLIPGIFNITDVDTIIMEDAKKKSISDVPSGVVDIVTLETLMDSHLFLPDNWKTPLIIHKIPLEESRFDFGLLFQEAREGTHTSTVTCLLDNSQIQAFGNSEAFTAALELKQAARVNGVVDITTPGWHELSCLRLKSVFTHEEDYSPSDILSAFIYKE